MKTTVFISYIHDSDEHCDQVLEFATLLQDCGVWPVIDRWVSPERFNWGVWAEQYIKRCDYTLAIASEDYRRVGNGEATDDENKGGQWEVFHMRDLLQRARTTWTKRLLPVVLPGHTVAEIPDFLQPNSANHYRISELTQEGIEGLLRTLTGQAEHVRPELGKPLVLPPKTGPGSPGWERRKYRC